MIEVVAIGNEVLRGAVLNSNAAYISQALFQQGWKVGRHSVLPDEGDLLKTGLQEALERSSIVITTGGLGPTFDDCTRKAVAELLSSGFHLNKEVEAHLEARFGKSLTSLKDQATIPRKAIPFLNRVGTAPGLLFHHKKKLLLMLPGVPVEMRAMFSEQVLPYLLEHFSPERRRYSESLHLCLMTESTIDPLLREFQATAPEVEIGIYPSQGSVTVSVTAENREMVEPLLNQIKAEFPKNVFSSVSGKIEEAVHELLIAKKKTLALAESCTGGRMASHLTSLSGASEYFLGSIVAYSNELKHTLLSVQEKTLREKGAVCPDTVYEMLLGLFEVTKADYGIAVSGIAGPTGAAPDKPVGTIWAAMGAQGEPPHIFTFHAKGNREKIILYSTNHLFSTFWQRLAFENK